MARSFRFTALASATLALTLLASAAVAFDELDEDIFGVDPVQDEQLAEMRGGFITVGGLQLDFALKNRTIVNGQELNNFILESTNMSEINSQNLQQVIQVGDGNQFESIDALMEIPGLVTVIQNSLSDTKIQNFNELDIVVNNFAEFQNNAPLTNAIQTSQQVGLR